MNARVHYHHPDDDFLPLEAPAPDECAPVASDDIARAVEDLKLELLLAQSKAPKAFLDRRVELQRTHGADAVTDPSSDVRDKARALAERAAAVRDRLSGLAEPTAEQRQLAARTLRTIGAIAFALFDQLEGQGA